MHHYNDVTMGSMASQITSLTIVFSAVYCRSKKISKLCVTGFCAGKSPGTGEFPAQMTSYAENASIWWRHHDVFERFGPGTWISVNMIIIYVAHICINKITNQEKIKITSGQCRVHHITPSIFGVYNDAMTVEMPTEIEIWIWLSFLVTKLESCKSERKVTFDNNRINLKRR